jgi:hypothetical protein
MSLQRAEASERGEDFDELSRVAPSGFASGGDDASPPKKGGTYEIHMPWIHGSEKVGIDV